MRVLIAEDNAQMLKSLMDGLLANGFDTICAKDGAETIGRLEREHPDALVLDIVMPQLDGLAVLSTLPKLRLLKRPSVIALSPFHGKGFAETRALELGASHLLPKPVELNRLIGMLHGAQPQSEPHLRHLAARMLADIGVPHNTKGGAYLAQATVLVATNYERIHNMSRDVYGEIAKQQNSTAKNVERVMRHAVETACTRGRLDTLRRLFGATLLGETGKPTNGEFIALMAERLRNARI